MGNRSLLFSLQGFDRLLGYKCQNLYIGYRSWLFYNKCIVMSYDEERIK